MFIFPNVYPDKIKSLDLPDYKTVSNSWKSGDKLFKRTQFAGSSTKLILEYRMISQNETDQLNLLWDFTEGFLLFTLPVDFFSKYPLAFKNAITNLKSTAFWCIDNPPEVTPKILCGSSDNVAHHRWNRYDLDLVITSQIS